MGAGRLPRRSRALSPPPPPPLLLEPLSLLEQLPGPQHVSERAEPAAPAPSTHPTRLPLPRANPRGLASGSCSQSGRRHAPLWFPPTPTPPRQLLAPRLHRRFCGSGESRADRQASASPALAVPARASLPEPAWLQCPVPLGAQSRPASTPPPPAAPNLSSPAPRLPPAFGFLLRPCSTRRHPSDLPPVPRFPAEQSAHFL
ncbi:unnamed protein product [Rangifer tarandus platyrhynchus]|uniref:Uncharacterized protein n=1 Tax=Rangifer tarandus platyrhynchus TaxID=3082113 RepID=A0ABN8ZVW6_RANTA|nr:unnamed protein product [Rangifer tarandus platyrhynchus]